MATVQVLAVAELKINGGLSVLRVTLKKEAKSGEVYAVMAQHSSGNHQFAYLNADEIDEVTSMMLAVQGIATENRPSEKTGEPSTPEQDK